MEDCAGRSCVANLSLGGGRSLGVEAAVAAATDAGMVMVVAAGNNNQDACQHSPAAEPKAIAVGSTTLADGRSGFSNWGDCVDVYAPGSAITSAWSTSPEAVHTISGTSMASPRECSRRVAPSEGASYEGGGVSVGVADRKWTPAAWPAA